MSFIHRFLASLVFVLSVVSGGGVQAQEEFVVLVGSDVVGAQIVPRCAELFRKEVRRVSFDIGGHGTEAAFTALAARTCRLGMAFRKMQESEAALLKKAGVEVEAVEIARDQVSVFVHPSNPVSKLTRAQLEKIFTGTITNWAEVGGPQRAIQLYGVHPSSEQSTFFKKYALGGKDFARTMPYGGPHPHLQLASRDPAGITYGNRLVPPDVLKMVTIDDATPGQDGVSTSYPWIRPYYIYVSKEATPAEREFMAYLLSKRAEEIIKLVGLLPPAAKK